MQSCSQQKQGNPPFHEPSRDMYSLLKRLVPLQLYSNSGCLIVLSNCLTVQHSRGTSLSMESALNTLPLGDLVTYSTFWQFFADHWLGLGAGLMQGLTHGSTRSCGFQVERLFWPGQFSTAG